MKNEKVRHSRVLDINYLDFLHGYFFGFTYLLLPVFAFVWWAVYLSMGW